MATNGAKTRHHIFSNIPSGIRYVLCVFILLFSVVLFYDLGLRALSQFYYLEAKGHLDNRCFGLAMACLKKADRLTPNDDKIQKGLGDVNFRFSILRTSDEKSFSLAQASRKFYLHAFELNPLDVEAAYGVARAEARLEQLFKRLHPDQKTNPYDPLPYYKKTVQLRPNGILYRYGMARYLHSHGQTEALNSVIRNLVRVYPPIYFSLKKTDLWSPSLKKPVKQGLEAAVAQKIALREAYHAFSSILSEEKNWEGALTYCQKAMQIQTFENKPRDYLRLGLLYLRNDKSQEAASAFARGMHMSRERSRDFETIYGYYKELGRPDQFHSFYQQVSHYFRLPYEAQILKARSLIDQEQYTLAKQILKNLNQQEPHAESYYWLARIGEKEQDYDAMELAIQKATVLDPKNSRYHLLFSKALRYVKKFDRAEREARLALEHSTTLNPWLFNHRAWIRWARKNYAGAISDWQTAIHLKPDKACFYAYTAEAYRKEGRQILAREYYEKALKFDPKNEKYKKRLHELLTEGA